MEVSSYNNISWYSCWSNNFNNTRIMQKVNEFLNGIIGKIVILVLGVFMTLFSGLTTYFIYRTFNTSEQMKDAYFEVRVLQYEQGVENKELHDAIMDTLESHWRQTLKSNLYVTTIKPNTAAIIENTRRSLRNEKNTGKLEDRVEVVEEAVKKSKGLF